MFNIIVQQDIFNISLDKLKKTVNEKPSTGFEFYSTVKLEVHQDQNGDTLKLTTFNGNEIGVAYCPCKVKENSTECSLINYNQLSTLVSSFPDTNINIVDNPDDNNILLSYSGRKTYIVLAKLPSSLFNIKPSLVNPFCQLECSTLKLIIDKAYNITEKSSNAMDLSVKLNLINNKCIATCKGAINKNMMKYEKSIPNSNLNIELLLDTQVLKKILDLLDDTKSVLIGQDNNYIVLSQDNIFYYFRKFNGTTMDISKFMPEKYSYEFKFNRLELLTSLNRTQAVCSSLNGMKVAVIKFSNLFTSICTDGERGTIQEDVTCEDINNTGKIIQMSFNVSNLIHLLLLLRPYEEVKICINSNSYAVIVPIDKNGNDDIKLLIPSCRTK